MLSSPWDIYVKNLTYTLYCGGVCGEGGAIKALLVKYWTDVGLPFLKYSELAMLRLRSYLCAPNSI